MLMMEAVRVMNSRNLNGAGKGDRPRPITNRKQYEENWDRIFSKKKKKTSKKSKGKRL